MNVNKFVTLQFFISICSFYIPYISNAHNRVEQIIIEKLTTGVELNQTFTVRPASGEAVCSVC